MPYLPELGSSFESIRLIASRAILLSAPVGRSLSCASSSHTSQQPGFWSSGARSRTELVIAHGGFGGGSGGEGDDGGDSGSGGGCGLSTSDAPTCRSCTPSSTRPATMAYLVEAVHAVRRAAHRNGAAWVAHVDELHAVVFVGRDDGVRARADDKGGDATRAIELVEAVRAVCRAAHRDGAAWVAHVDQLHAVVIVGRHDRVRARADDKGGDSTRAAELVEAVHAVRRAANRDGAAWVAHIDQLHAVVVVAQDDGVRARADDKDGDGVRTLELGEAVHAVRRTAHRDGAAWVAHVNDLHAVVGEARHDGVRAGADDKGGDADRALELSEAVHAVRRAAHRSGAAWVAHIDQLHAIVGPSRRDGVRARADDKGGDALRAVELIEAVHAVRRAAHRDGAAWVTHIDQLHAIVVNARHNGVRARADDKGGDEYRAVELVEAVHAVRRAAHREGVSEEVWWRCRRRRGHRRLLRRLRTPYWHG
eukprot:scaffold106227_cov63-Phaeocystis_antarctica.AAC.1